MIVKNVENREPGHGEVARDDIGRKHVYLVRARDRGQQQCSECGGDVGDVSHLHT